MPTDRWFDVNEIAFRARGSVVARYEKPCGETVLDVEVSDETIVGVELSDELMLSVVDPDDQYPAELVGESRTLAFAIEGFPEVRPADQERTVLEVPDEGRLDVVGRRTSESAWDGETLTVPIDVGIDEMYVPIRETTRPRREPNAARELVEEAGIADCEYVAADGCRLTLYAVDLEVETDPWAGVVFEDVTFEVDTDDERFRTAVAERNGLDADASMRVRVGPRWLLGSADRFGQDDLIDGHLAGLMDTLVAVLDGESAIHRFVYAPIRYEFEPAEAGVVRVELRSDTRRLNPHFPPGGALLDAEAFAKAVLGAGRDVLRRVEELNPEALDAFANVRASANALELELRVRGVV